ncbi:oligosaccharyl transferase alpha subunit [Crepidotus variabilis]|uniref:Dolichyl-diphosphooligosaccharide--protein glycosyltransferase subunit 1 n=1 Tax=Crepidotus variabilis TaxID=179855 RepID=A0A9P6JVX5_9AGAR|nr:oligosaccharyl transferase alpha subunit [Crepidotus variabilis]
MSPSSWRTLPFLLLVSVTSVFASSKSFENTAIVRTAELGGSVVHVTTTYAIKALDDGQKTYTVALGRAEREKTSFIEAKVKGSKEPLKIKERALDTSKDYHLVDITLPKALSTDKTLNLVLETVQTHATWPSPATAAQNEDQSLKYQTNLLILSPYKTSVQRTKVKTLSPRIISYTTPENAKDLTDKDVVTKSGATVTYGPYDNLPSSTNKEFIEKYQQSILIHYHHEQPVLEVLNLQRSVEVSHWGANINTEDKIDLYNAGPKLKGHFSRLQHQSQKYFNKLSAHVLPALTLHLPAGLSNPYYYDLIGNVSTSNIRIAPSVPKNKQGTQFSVLEIRPRYPLLGGWNYTFTLGWDLPLGDVASYDKSAGKYTVEVPIMTPLLGAVVNNAELSVVLPEGASNIEILEPFPALAKRTDIHKTYLDTTGRPRLTFIYKNLTVKHAESIYVSYKLSWVAHLKKPVAVSTAILGLFTLGMFVRRINLSLTPTRKV